MTDREFETIALALKASYPNSNVLPDKYAMRTWFEALADLDARVASNAVWEHISTSVFPPSIAEIRQKCSERLSPMITDWGEAWEEVLMAIRKYGSYREDEAVNSLSKLTAIAVRRMGFRNLCMSENTVADRAHFQRIYEGMVKEEKRQVQLPNFVREKKDEMIKGNTPRHIECAEKKTIEEKKERAAPEYIDGLIKKFKGSIQGK